MSFAAETAGPRCTLKVLPAARMVELVFFSPWASVRGAQGLPPPGGARRGAYSDPTILHFAPARCLLADPGPELDAWIAAVAADGAGTAVEVEGKWASFELSGPCAAQVLAASLDVSSILESRDCAAVVLFDCPAVLASVGTHYLIYVKASYAAHFAAAVGRSRASVQVA